MCVIVRVEGSDEATVTTAVAIQPQPASKLPAVFQAVVAQPMPRLGDHCPRSIDTTQNFPHHGAGHER